MMIMKEGRESSSYQRIHTRWSWDVPCWWMMMIWDGTDTSFRHLFVTSIPGEMTPLTGMTMMMASASIDDLLGRGRVMRTPGGSGFRHLYVVCNELDDHAGKLYGLCRMIRWWWCTLHSPPNCVLLRLVTWGVRTRYYQGCSFSCSGKEASRDTQTEGKKRKKRYW